MKTEARVLDVTTTLEGEKVGMSIDPGALAHIMSVLTDLYSDPEMAVIREYSTNALDAHVEAGINKPIEITLPSSLAPFFRVRDYGTGLNAEDIRNIYSRYGASSKRESNDVVGMLGLGCKSALTYTDQFTLSGTKDGVCTQVSISRDEDGGGSMTIVAEYQTDDPSGVEIIVPAKGYNEFETKATEFFKYWKSGTVLVNGSEPPKLEGTWLAKDLLIVAKEHGRYGDRQKDVVVMGNVAYPLSDNDYHQIDGRYAIVAFVNIGDVNFTPSRETLQMTKKTKTTIENIKERVKKERDAAFTKEVQNAATRADALKKYHEVKHMGLSITVQYKGQDIPESYKAVKDAFLLVRGRKSYGDRGWNKELALGSSYYSRCVWLTGYEADTFTPHKRKQLDQWLEEKGLDRPEYFVLIKDVPAEILLWIDASTVHPWEEVAAQKIVRVHAPGTKLSNGRVSGSYEGYVNGVFQKTLLAVDIDTSKPVLYTSRDASMPVSNLNQHHPKGWTVVQMSNNRVNKFQRDFPKAETLNTHLRKLADAWLKKLNQEQLIKLYMEANSVREGFYGWDASQVDDPDLNLAIRVAHDHPNLIREYDLHRHWVSLPPIKWENPLHKYHLLTSGRGYGRMSQTTMKHAYLYVNAAFAAEQES